MTRPTKHPKSGTYRIRLMIPPMLRDAAHRLHGVRTELVESLGTKDAREAVRSAPAALVRLQDKLAAIRAAAEGRAPVPTDRDIAGLAGEAYRWRVRAQGDNAGDALNWHHHLDDIGDRLGAEIVDGSGRVIDRDVMPSRIEIIEARSALREAGWSDDPQTVNRAAVEIMRIRSDFAQMMLKRTRGDWSDDTTAQRFPAVAPPSAPKVVPKVGPKPSPGCDMTALVKGWAADRGMNIDARPIQRAAYDRLRTLIRLGAFMGHQDASKVVRADAVRWKEDMQGRGLAVPTVRNDLSECSALWTWGIANGKLPEGNPFSGLLPPKAKKRAKAVRPFTRDEAAMILEAARGRSGFLRWAPWVLCFTGARVGEIAQATRSDIVTIHGVTALRIHDEGEGASVKNAASVRTVPIHPALMAEGFIEYVAALPLGSPLWPDVPLSKSFGTRASEASRVMTRWLRNDLKLADQLISPSHSWRHYFIDAARGVVMPEEVRNAITGHTGHTNESAGYGSGMKAMIVVLAENLARIPSPLADA